MARSVKSYIFMGVVFDTMITGDNDYEGSGSLMYIGVKGQGQKYFNISVWLATRTPLTILRVGGSYL